MSESTGVPIATTNHPANQASCYVHYRLMDGADKFSEYFNSTKEATQFARTLIYDGTAQTAVVIKPQITYSRRTDR